MSFSCRNSRAFTLIELLVVIAIIALLASILMPTLQKAQEFANKSKCASQFNAHDKGYRMYANDFDEYIVATVDFKVNGVSQGSMYRSWMLDYIYTKGRARYFQTLNTNDVGKDRENEIFLCPTSIKKKDTSGSAFGLPWDSMTTSRAYSTSTCYASVAPRRYNDYIWPAEISGELDSRMGGSAYTLQPQWYIDQNGGGQWSSVSYRHPGPTLNVLYVDGHVKSITESQGISGKGTYLTRVGPQ